MPELHRGLAAAFVAAACIAVLLAPGASAGPDGACTIQHRFFYVSAADLTETVTAHWKYTDGDGHDATVDTTQTGVMTFRNSKLGSRAERKRGHQYGQFDELQRTCRIPDYRQGRLYWEAPMNYTLSGQWTTPTASGPCNGEAADGRILRAEFIRRSLDWHYPTVGFRWELPGPSNPRCQIQASDGDQQLNGTVVLKRYRACSVSTLAQILHGQHCWDPSYP
jgi:hypothetical protein